VPDWLVLDGEAGLFWEVTAVFFLPAWIVLCLLLPEISFELKKPVVEAGQNQPVTTSTVGHGQIKYIDGGRRSSLCQKIVVSPIVSAEAAAKSLR
jgi:hypothetical protein